MRKRIFWGWFVWRYIFGHCFKWCKCWGLLRLKPNIFHLSTNLLNLHEKIYKCFTSPLGRRIQKKSSFKGISGSYMKRSTDSLLLISEGYNILSIKLKTSQLQRNSCFLYGEIYRFFAPPLRRIWSSLGEKEIIE